MNYNFKSENLLENKKIILLTKKKFYFILLMTKTLKAQHDMILNIMDSIRGFHWSNNNGDDDG